MAKIPGLTNVADIQTKFLDPGRFWELMSMLPVVFGQRRSTTMAALVIFSSIHGVKAEECNTIIVEGFKHATVLYLAIMIVVLAISVLHLRSGRMRAVSVRETRSTQTAPFFAPQYGMLTIPQLRELAMQRGVRIAYKESKQSMMDALAYADSERVFEHVVATNPYV